MGIKKEFALGILLIPILILLISIFIYLDAGNFFRMRQIAFAEFHNRLRSADINPKLFVGPKMDITYQKTLVFEWCHPDTTEAEPVCVKVYVPPYFGSFRSQVRGSGTQAAWMRLAGTMKRSE